MKALMGDIATKVRKDPRGRREMKKYLLSNDESTVITLTTGEKYLLTSKQGRRKL